MTEFDKDVNEALQIATGEQPVAPQPEEERPPEEVKRERRLMRTSTFKALASLEYGPPEAWDPEFLQETLENTQAVERMRWSERWVWISALFALGVAGFSLAWMVKPMPEPEPVEWSCVVTYDHDGKEQVECSGVDGGR